MCSWGYGFPCILGVAIHELLPLGNLVEVNVRRTRRNHGNEEFLPIPIPSPQRHFAIQSLLQVSETAPEAAALHAALHAVMLYIRPYVAGISLLEYVLSSRHKQQGDPGPAHEVRARSRTQAPRSLESHRA
jgi:hypothetical protein